MSVTIIITACILLLVSYVFDLSSAKTKIPSVILLLLLGWGMRQLSALLQITLPDFSPLLPILGTIGLILIVLEGSLELKLNLSKLRTIKKTFYGALLSILALAFILAFVFHYTGGYGFKDSLLNAIPLCVISSAIAIPSVRNLNEHNKEFVIYESSFSDIFGVVIFNFLELNETIDTSAFSHFILELLLISIVSFFAIIGLSLLLSRIEHHIKYIPIILLVILIYAVTKIFHLPGLIFILLFGLALGNLDGLKRFSWIEKFKPDYLTTEVKKFRELTVEGAFLVRSTFFLVFGYLIETDEVINTETIGWAIGIVSLILLLRTIQLKLSGLTLKPLLFVAPRGLITILLFLSIDQTRTISPVNNSLIIQIILLMAFVMMVGIMLIKPRNQ